MTLLVAMGTRPAADDDPSGSRSWCEDSISGKILIRMGFRRSGALTDVAQGNDASTSHAGKVTNLFSSVLHTSTSAGRQADRADLERQLASYAN